MIILQYHEIFFRLTAPRCPGMAAGAVSLRKSHDIVILSFCNIVKGQANYLILVGNGPNHLLQRTSCRTFIALDVHQILLDKDVLQDSTGCPCKFASNVLELSISLKNAIKISIGCPVEFLLDERPLESSGRPVELLYRKSTRAEDLAVCQFSPL